MDRIHLVHQDSLSCEPILRRMPNNELLLISQCGDVTEPAPGNRVYAFHSKDNGITWSKKESIWPEDGNAVYLTEVMVLHGVVSVFITIHNGYFLHWKCFIVISRDNGYTWENDGPAPHLPEFTFFRGMIRLKNGNILIPFQHYPVSPEENDRLVKAGLKWYHAQIEHVETGTLLSTDGGKTYMLCNGFRTSFNGTTGLNWVWSEPTIAELSDGTIGMLIRIDGTGFLWLSESKDGGKTFSPAAITNIPNPSNKPKLIGLPDGRTALIHTPNKRIGMEYRNPLAIWISDDDMKTWQYKHIVTNFPGSFSYADGFYEDGHILFSIEHNRRDILFIDHKVE